MALPANFVDTANQRYKDGRRFLNNWRGEARDSFAFIAGDQWDEADKKKLEDEGRPYVTFNYSEKMVDAVVGAEVSNRQEVTYRPREVSDASTSELWNNAAKWARDGTFAEDEDSDAFRDGLICGIGWTRTRMNYDEDPDGSIEVSRIDPLTMVWDPASTKPSLADRRWQCHEWRVDEREAKQQWPDVLTFTSSDEDSRGGGVVTRGSSYDDTDTQEEDRNKNTVMIRLYECYERVAFYRVAVGTEMMEMSAEEFRKVKKDLDAAGTQYVRQFKKVYYQAYFSGETLLEGDLSPCQVGFTYQAITGKRDRNKNTWYGLTRVMKDPQRWANKWLSQILHIVNSNAKGGLMAEVGAFMDPRKAQEEWSKTDAVTLLNEGGLTKVKEKTMANYPSGLDRLMDFALQSLPMVTGINLEALGLANREQAGVLEQQRKQAAYGLLSPLFDSLRRYRKSQGRVMLDFINRFISDGRMVRIGGPESAQFLPLTKVEGAARYDVFVDQSPNAPDVKEKSWSTLVQILPAMMKAGLPIPPDLLDYTPLPVALSTKWKQFIAESEKKKQGPTNEQMQQLQQQAQQAIQKLTEENQKLQQALRDKSGELQLKSTEMEQTINMKWQSMQADMALKEEKMRGEFALAQQELRAQIILDIKRLKEETEIKREAAEHKADTAPASNPD